MSSLRDTLLDWIDARVHNMLAAPRAWGSDEAIEMQVLLLLELRALALNPQQELEDPGRIFKAYATHLSRTYPAKLHRPLSQIVETDHLGHALASELQRAVDVLARTAMSERPLRSGDVSNFAGYDEFRSACDGDLDAIRSLTKRYPYATFVLSIKGKKERCRNLHFDAQGMTYRFAEAYVRHPKRVDLSSVEGLVRMEAGSAPADGKHLRLVA